MISSMVMRNGAVYRIIRDYGEDKFAKNIAKHIVAARQAETDHGQPEN